MDCSPRPPPRLLEPKTFLANERTLIAWINVCVVMAGVSLGLMLSQQSEDGSFATSAAGGLVGLSSVFFLWWAFLAFKRRSAALVVGAANLRSSQIATAGGGSATALDSPVGPTVFAVTLAGLMTIQAAVHLGSSQWWQDLWDRWN